MSITAEQVIMDAIELPTPLRAFVAEKLIESLDALDSPSLLRNGSRRCVGVVRRWIVGMSSFAMPIKSLLRLSPSSHEMQ